LGALRKRGALSLRVIKTCPRRSLQDGIRRLACLSWDAATGLRWARLLADLRASGQTMPVKDSMIEATALAQGLTVATRNTRDFAKTGVRIVNPFEDAGQVLWAG
jgi:predicted nucleic acid-binding protein